MEIRINPNEILEEVQKRFPKELEICVQGVQIRKMGELLDEATPEDEDVDLKVVEDFSDLSADLVHDDVVEGAQDTLSLLDRYVDEIETKLDKERIKSKLKSLYIESSDLEA